MLLTAGVGSLMLMRKRSTMEVFPPRVRKLWKEWELRALVFISLVAQIVLITLGNRRKYTPKTWIKVYVWSAYMLADSVATVALGILLSDLGQMYDDGGTLQANNELTAFWAPFLLLHLGGPDTITAYSLEDNDLFLRHAFELVSQTIVTILIFVMAWNGSLLSTVLMPSMILVGFIKYGERTWALWSASIDRFRSTILKLTPHNPSFNYSKLMNEYNLKRAEGFHVEVEELRGDQPIENDQSQPALRSSSADNNIMKADALFQTFKCLFADLVISFQHRDTSPFMHHEDAFNVIAIELGFIYDLLYTKARVIYTPWGLASRAITTFLTCLALVIFVFADKNKYHKVDIAITFILLLVAIVLELVAAFLLVFSDQSHLWFIKHNKTTILESLHPLEPQRWSNSMAKLNLISLSLKEKPRHKILRLIHLDELWEEQRYISYEEVPEDLKSLIFNHIEEKFNQFKRGRDTSLRDLNTQWGRNALGKEKHLDDLEWSINVAFDQSILIWHMATQLCCEAGSDGTKNSDDTNRKMSKLLSEYMLYLLVTYPFLLPVGTGITSFEDTCSGAKNFFKQHLSVFDLHQPQNTSAACDQKTEKRKKACQMILEMNTDVLPNRSKSVLFDASKLASQLNAISDLEQKWRMIRDVWLEMLAYAAGKSRGIQHARHVRRGGELFTHVWLLMAHFGLTDQFQIFQGHQKAKLIAR